MEKASCAIQESFKLAIGLRFCSPHTWQAELGLCMGGKSYPMDNSPIAG